MKTPEQIELTKFVTKWLWESENRRTQGREWDLDYVNDAAQMIADAREGMVPAAELRPTIELLKRICSHYYAPTSAHFHLINELRRLENLLGEKGGQ